MREVRLSMAVQSHLSDVMYENESGRTPKLRFIKTIIHWNPNLEIEVETAYLDWLWEQVLNGGFGGEYTSWKECN